MTMAGRISDFYKYTVGAEHRAARNSGARTSSDRLRGSAFGLG